MVERLVPLEPLVSLLGIGRWSGSVSRMMVRGLSQHSGLPMLLVAAVLTVACWRLLRKTLRFAVELVVVTAALAAMTQLGWIRW